MNIVLEDSINKNFNTQTSRKLSFSKIKYSCINNPKISKSSSNKVASNHNKLLQIINKVREDKSNSVNQ